MIISEPTQGQPEKVALITGVTGQDGAYLSEFLLSKNYLVHGIKRRSSQLNTGRIDHLYQDPHESPRRRRRVDLRCTAATTSVANDAKE